MPPHRRRKKPNLSETAGEGEPPCNHKKKKKKNDGGSSGSGAPPVYMVVAHGCERPSYSVFKVDDPYAGGKGKGAPGRAVARLKCKHTKSFVPVRSRHGAWIVGVGGSTTESSLGPDTIIFDTETHAVIAGLNTRSIKTNPLLLTVGERIYAMTRRPSMNGRVDYAFDGRINFLPWFEVLDLSNSKVVGGCLTGCEWKPLPRPPFFPWVITIRDYFNRTVSNCQVRSYTSVGSYLLFSSAGKPATYAFDTETEQWTTVDDNNNLPFIQRAIPHGGPELFLGMSRATRSIAVYKISVTAGLSSLAIEEIPVVSDLPGDEQVVTTDHFVSLGINRGFCSVTRWNVDESLYPPFYREHIKFIAYQTEDFEGKCHHVTERWKQLYEIHDPIRWLDKPCVAGVFSI